MCIIPQNQRALDINESATKQNYERCQWKNIRSRKIETYSSNKILIYSTVSYLKEHTAAAGIQGNYMVSGHMNNVRENFQLEPAVQLEDPRVRLLQTRVMTSGLRYKRVKILTSV